MATESRYDRLYAWMLDHRISYPALAKELGVSESGARRLCNSETIPVHRHDQLVQLGFPVDLLPAARDRPKGRPRAVPIFPGLLTQDQESLSAS